MTDRLPNDANSNNNDLGLGTRVAEQSRTRFLNRDGSFNVRRAGQRVLDALSPYHALLSMSWPRYHLMVGACYFGTNLVFAIAYMLCGPEALRGGEAIGVTDRFIEAFFFSVQTLATIGYGRISPVGLAANALVSVEALVGLLGFALVTGLLFARFSRPNARLVFSRNAIVAPYRGGRALEFRFINGRTQPMIEVSATVTMSMWQLRDGKRVRAFHWLELERSSVTFMPLHWVVVHPITESSPLFGLTHDAILEGEAEIMIQVSCIDEMFSQTVHTRTSYKAQEILWSVKFADMYVATDDGIMTIDVRKLDVVEPAVI